MSLTQTDILIGLSFAGVFITSQEWVNIWSAGTLRGIGRLFMLNLPIVILLSEYLTGRI